MMTSHVTITREVKRHMQANHLSQSDIARSIGLTQGAVSKKLLGQRAWSLDDLDALMAIGVPIGLSNYETLLEDRR